MLGTDGRLYDSNFDFDGDGKLNAYEYSVMDGCTFGKFCGEKLYFQASGTWVHS